MISSAVPVNTKQDGCMCKTTSHSIDELEPCTEAAKWICGLLGVEFDLVKSIRIDLETDGPASITITKRASKKTLKPIVDLFMALHWEESLPTKRKRQRRLLAIPE